MVFKTFFCSEFPVIPENWWGKEEEEMQLRIVMLFMCLVHVCACDDDVKLKA